MLHGLLGPKNYFLVLVSLCTTMLLRLLGPKNYFLMLGEPVHNHVTGAARTLELLPYAR